MVKLIVQTQVAQW